MAQEVVENLLNPIILPSRCLRELEVIGEECKKKKMKMKKSQIGDERETRLHELHRETKGNLIWSDAGSD